MIKNITLFTLLSVFAFTVSAPNIIALLVKDAGSVNILLETPDEEKQESEVSKEKDVKIIEISDLYAFSNNELHKKLGLFNEQKYASVYLKMIFPPPELS